MPTYEITVADLRPQMLTLDAADEAAATKQALAQLREGTSIDACLRTPVEGESTYVRG